MSLKLRSNSSAFLAFKIFALLALCAAVSGFKKDRMKLPSFVKVCHRNDPNLSSCVRDSIHSLKDRISLGIPELFVPPLEPLIVPEVRMDQDSGAIYMHSTFKDIEIHGLSNFTLSDMVVDANRLKFSMTLSFPNISMKAHYKMKGKIMMMPLMGDGDCSANFTDVEVHGVIMGTRYKHPSGRQHIKAKEIKTKYSLGKTELQLENLFNGDNALGDRMNTFLNENWEELSEEIRPLMENALAEILRASTDKLFKTYCLDELLPE